MTSPIADFLFSKKQVMDFFDCDDNYFIKPMVDASWKTKAEDGMWFLSYYDDGKNNSAVIVKNGNRPLIFKRDEYTMVIAIECIKIAFIFKNCNQQY